MLKVYGIHGRTQCIIKVPVNEGKAWVECEFKGGRIGAGIANRPATYPTANEVEQQIIENSPMFGHLITLHRIAGVTKDAPAKQEEPENALKAITSVTSKEEAVAYLKEQGAKATDLRSDAAIKRYAAGIGVCFPNLYE